MLRSFARCLLVLSLLVLTPTSGAGQVRGSYPPHQPPHRIVGIRQVTQKAGIIFQGRVASVRRIPASAPDSVDTVQISFQVEQSVRGARSGQILTIREWAGLWVGSERYRVGQRMLLVLYPPSKLGLTSPVGGTDGRFLIDKDAGVVLSPLQQQWLNTNKTISPDEHHRVALRDLTRAVRRAAAEE
jgi:hypothetical protein